MVVNAYVFIAEASSPERCRWGLKTGNGVLHTAGNGPRKVVLINHPNCNLENGSRQTFFGRIPVDDPNQLCHVVGL